MNLKKLPQEELYKERIGKLRCFKDVDTTAAIICHVEVSDFNRFPNAKAFVSFSGLIPNEDLSEDKNK